MKTYLMRVLVLLLAFSGTALRAQDLDREQVRQLVENKSFIFKAQSVSPMGGSVKQLTSEYDLKVLGDSIATYLPYFGRAYTAPMPGESGGIHFTSSSFHYSFREKKKGNYEVTITPQDVSDVRQLLLTVTPSGYAMLQVTSNNRQPISFNGYIVASKR